MTIMGSNHMHDSFREEIVQYAKYAKDPIAFIKDNRYGFNTIKEKFEFLPLVEFQVAFLNNIHNNKFNITKKSRQMHMTSLTAAYCAWKLIFFFDKSIAIVCPRKDDANRFIELVRIMLQRYSNNFFHWEDDFVKDNKSEIRLTNGSFIKAFAPNASAMRGYSIDMLIFDEAAFIKDMPEIWMTLGMVINARTNSKCIMYSTPNDFNFFQEVWTRAVNDENNFSALSLDYRANPDYNNPEWYERMCKRLNYDKNSIAQELHGEFTHKKITVSKRINFRIESKLYDKIIEKIDETRISLSNYVKDLIKKDLGE